MSRFFFITIDNTFRLLWTNERGISFSIPLNEECVHGTLYALLRASVLLVHKKQMRSKLMQVNLNSIIDAYFLCCRFVLSSFGEQNEKP